MDTLIEELEKEIKKIQPEYDATYAEYSLKLKDANKDANPAVIPTLFYWSDYTIADKYFTLKEFIEYLHTLKNKTDLSVYMSVRTDQLSRRLYSEKLLTVNRAKARARLEMWLKIEEIWSKYERV